MATYLITVKGKGQKEAKGESPQDAFATLFPNIELQEIKDKTQAQVCIELLGGKRKSKTFYFVKKITQEKPKRVSHIDTDAINIGYAVGHSYFRYISKDFGTVTNDIFTVGHKIIKAETREFKEYKGFGYVLHKDINAIGSPDTPLCALFRTDDTNVYIEILLGRQSYLSETARIAGIVGYIYNFGTMIFNKKENVDIIAKKLAEKFNQLLPIIYDIADNNQSLYSLKDYNAPIETITNIEHINDDIALLHAAVSRWTTIRGDKTPAKVEKIQMNGVEDIKVLYSNNVSDSGGNCKLFVEYASGNFTIRVVDGKDMKKVLCSDTDKMSGPINKNSPKIGEIMGKCLISANVSNI